MATRTKTRVTFRWNFVLLCALIAFLLYQQIGNLSIRKADLLLTKIQSDLPPTEEVEEEVHSYLKNRNVTDVEVRWLDGLHIPQTYFNPLLDLIDSDKNNTVSLPKWLSGHTKHRFSLDAREVVRTFLDAPPWLCYVGLLHARLNLHRFHKRQWRHRFQGPYSTCHSSHHARYRNMTLHNEVMEVCEHGSHNVIPRNKRRVKRAIIVEAWLSEGLGNQLFQIAFAERLAAVTPRVKTSAAKSDLQLRIVGSLDPAIDRGVLKPFMYSGDADLDRKIILPSRCTATYISQSPIDTLLLSMSKSAVASVVIHDRNVSAAVGPGVIISDKPSYATSARKTGFPPFVFQLLLLATSLRSSKSNIGCVTLDGWFQEIGYYYNKQNDAKLPTPPIIASSAAPRELSSEMLQQIVMESGQTLKYSKPATVIHVRRCEDLTKKLRQSNDHQRTLQKMFYPSLPVQYYFKAMSYLGNIKQALVLVVTPPTCRQSHLVQELLSFQNATVRLIGSKSMPAATHFAFIRSAGNNGIPIVLSVGTFSWWLAWLTEDFTKISVPLIGCQRHHTPLISNEEQGGRFTYYVPNGNVLEWEKDKRRG